MCGGGADDEPRSTRATRSPPGDLPRPRGRRDGLRAAAVAGHPGAADDPGGAAHHAGRRHVGADRLPALGIHLHADRRAARRHDRQEADVRRRAERAGAGLPARGGGDVVAGDDRGARDPGRGRAIRVEVEQKGITICSPTPWITRATIITGNDVATAASRQPSASALSATTNIRFLPVMSPSRPTIGVEDGCREQVGGQHPRDVGLRGVQRRLDRRQHRDDQRLQQREGHHAGREDEEGHLAGSASPG